MSLETRTWLETRTRLETRTWLETRTSHIHKTQGFWGRISSHILKTHGFWGAGSGARRARRHTGGAAHILKTQGFWGRTRVRRIYLKRKGFEDERAFVAYT